MRSQESLYAEVVGRAALERQKREAADRFECCGEREVDGHHPLCAKRPKDVPPPVVGQESLL